uniref:Uncharacterized protein n=1 Tax=Cyprinus carpio TaxID=7962 RepID=A0A8C2F962_CYPCA
MGMCSRQERIQKDVDIVIQRCKAEKDCLFSGEFPFLTADTFIFSFTQKPDMFKNTYVANVLRLTQFNLSWTL